MSKTDYRGIWVFAEQEGGVLEPTVFELLAKARELKAHNGEQISAVLLGSGVEALGQHDGRRMPGDQAEGGVEGVDVEQREYAQHHVVAGHRRWVAEGTELVEVRGQRPVGERRLA